MPVSDDVMVTHLINVGGYTKTLATNMLKHFQMSIDKRFWKCFSKEIVKYNKDGFYLRVLGVPGEVLHFFPFFVAHCGDEPGQRRMCGMFCGKHFLISI
jgi:hypothetical protein